MNYRYFGLNNEKIIQIKKKQFISKEGANEEPHLLSPKWIEQMTRLEYSYKYTLLGRSVKD